MENKKNSLVPLRFIRIAKDMKLKEMAEAFEVTLAYISAIEKSERNIKKQTLLVGLNNLNINYVDYLETLLERKLDRVIVSNTKIKRKTIKNYNKENKSVESS